MIQQTIIYYTSGSTAVLEENNTRFVFKDVTLNIEGITHNSSGSGGFESTIGTIRINLYSGSVLVADFPYDKTNLIINSSSALFSSFSLPNVNLQYPITYSGSEDPTFSFILKESSSLELITQDSLINGTNVRGIGLDSSSVYLVEVHSGNNKYNQISLYDQTGSLLSTDSWVIGTGSFTIEPTGSSNFNLVLEVSGSTCCSPTLLFIENIGYESLQFNYLTGSCGTFSSMSVFQSDDKINWSLLTTGYSDNNIISPSGSYPLSLKYYRLIQHCDDGLDLYNSDPSNILYYEPLTQPNLSEFYNISIVGRCSSGSLYRTFLYSIGSSSYDNLGRIHDVFYNTEYRPITSFYIPSGSTVYFNPNPCISFGVGYEGSYYTYCSYTADYTITPSGSTTIYFNLANTSAACC